MRHKIKDNLCILCDLIVYMPLLPFSVLADLLRRAEVPLWLLRAMTWHKRRKAPGPKDVDRLPLTPREHLILSKLEGTNR